MVVGKGLLAKAFSHFQNDDSVIVFASGVSNSNSNDPLHYEREINLLNQYLDQEACLVYFSTVSVYDHSLQQSQYIIHKMKIEKLIQENCADYLIFRLPILVGRTANPHTLTNHLYEQIKSNQEVKVFANACRYLMDIDDVSEILTSIISSTYNHNKILNICFNNQIRVTDLILLMEKILKRECKKILLKKGGCYQVQRNDFQELLNVMKFEINPDYNESILNKYYSS